MHPHAMNSFRWLIVLALAVLPGCSETDEIASSAPVTDRYTPFPGGVSGEPVRDLLHITVVDAFQGKPVKGAIVEVHRGIPFVSVGSGETSKEGTLDLPIPESSVPLTVTVRGAETQAYDTLTVMGVRSSNLVLPFTLRKPYRQHPVSIAVSGIRPEDAALRLFEGDSEGKTIPITAQGEIFLTTPDPVRMRIPVTSPGISALTFDANHQVRHVGFIPLFDTPIVRNATYDMALDAPHADAVREIECTVDTTALTTGKSAKLCASPRFTITAYADSGPPGRMTIGLAELLLPGVATLRIHHVEGIDTIALEASLSCPDLLSQTLSMAQFKWNDIPKEHVFVMKKPATGLELHETPDCRFPGLKWIAGDGTIAVVHVYQREFNYHWQLWMENSPGENRIELPPIEPGAAGSLCETLVYEYIVETLGVRDAAIDTLSFDVIHKAATHRTVSAPLQFTIHGIPTPTPSPEPTLQPYDPVATDITPSTEPTPTPVLDESGIEVVPAPEG